MFGFRNQEIHKKITLMNIELTREERQKR